VAEDRAQRTEEATPRRLQKAREEGQVASSRELTMALQFAAAVGLLSLYSERVVGGIIETTRGLFQQSFRRDLSVGELQGLMAAVLRDGMSFVFPLGLTLVAVGLLMHLGQTGFALSTKKLTPDVNRLNPLAKLRDLPGENLLQAFKAAVLLPLFGVVLWQIVSSRLDGFLSLAAMTAAAGTVAVAQAVMDLLMKAAACLAALGLFDLYRQRRRLSVKLRMTKAEVRREQKDLEGDPHIKARMRRLRREMRRRRMMSDVPKATVVITNPTHHAVALRYEPHGPAAPVVVAKGLDLVALRIRAIDEEHGIAIVENPPLARLLYRSAEVGKEIPEDLYRTVAEILAYIYSLRGQRPF
jgi:flagellar biosynthetic protein FlhB